MDSDKKTAKKSKDKVSAAAGNAPGPDINHVKDTLKNYLQILKYILDNNQDKIDHVSELFTMIINSEVLQQFG